VFLPCISFISAGRELSFCVRVLRLTLCEALLLASCQFGVLPVLVCAKLGLLPRRSFVPRSAICERTISKEWLRESHIKFQQDDVPLDKDEFEAFKEIEEPIESSNTGFHSDAEVGVICADVGVDCADVFAVRSKPRTDVFLAPKLEGSKESSSKESSTPFALIEVGRHDLD
jgi:hypothetical protein